MKKQYVVIAVLLALAFVLSACGGGNATPATEIEVVMTDFTFAPTEFTLAAGKEITISAINNGAVLHEFVIIKKGMEVSMPFDDDDEDKVFWEIEVEPGGSTTVTFTAPAEPGEYQLVCGTPGHLEAGMLGTVTIK